MKRFAATLSRNDEYQIKSRKIESNRNGFEPKQTESNRIERWVSRKPHINCERERRKCNLQSANLHSYGHLEARKAIWALHFLNRTICILHILHILLHIWRWLLWMRPIQYMCAIVYGRRRCFSLLHFLFSQSLFSDYTISVQELHWSTVKNARRYRFGEWADDDGTENQECGVCTTHMNTKCLNKYLTRQPTVKTDFQTAFHSTFW